jgi:hypothetical protein
MLAAALLSDELCTPRCTCDRRRAHQLAQWWLRKPGVTRAQVVETYASVTWNGLAVVLGVT